MLEAGMSLVAVNLPSLWLLLTKIIPEKVARSWHSALSLHSQRKSNSNVARGAAAGNYSIRLSDKPGTASSADSRRPYLPTDVLQTPSYPHKIRQQVQDEAVDQTDEAYPMHQVERKDSQAQLWMP